MKIALIGASGNIGSKILSEALSRNHQVTAIVRDIAKLPQHQNLAAVKADINQSNLSSILAGHDAVISSVHFSGFNPENLLSAIKSSGVKRYISVGGAGSLEIKPGLKVIDTPEFPEIWKQEAGAGVQYLEALKQEKELDWTFLSPSALIADGQRTGKFRLGKDQLLLDSDGKSHISTEDYAIALIDELENPRHIKERFTVGY